MGERIVHGSSLKLTLSYLVGFIIAASKLHPSLGYTYHGFDRRTMCTSAHPPKEPRDLSDLQNIVRYALIANLKVKPIGSLHSSTDCICTDGIPVRMHYINHFSFDPQTNFATVGSGSDLGDFMDKLHKNGRALTSAPDYGGVTIGGGLGTGAHGTSILHPSTLSDQIVSVKVVDGLGNVRVVSDKEEIFAAFKVNLGLLGIIYEAVFRTVPQFKLIINTFPIPDEILWNGTSLLSHAENKDIFSFFWYPTSRKIVISSGTAVDVNERGTCETHFITDYSFLETAAFGTVMESLQFHRDRVAYFLMQSLSLLSLYTKVPARTPMFTEADGAWSNCMPVSTGFSHKMITNKCKQCFWQYDDTSFVYDDPNYIFPMEELFPVLETLREIVTEYPAEFIINGLYFRFLTGSNSFIGASSGGGTWVELGISTIMRFYESQPRLGLAAVQAMGQAVIEKHRGRPHWAKNGMAYHHSELYWKIYPNIDRFVEVMDEMDPYGVFMNNIGKRIRKEGGEGKLPKYCALVEDCVCERDLDCGDGGENDFECGKLLEYSVCREKPNFIYDFAAIVAQHLISGLAAAPIAMGNLVQYFWRNENLRKLLPHYFI